MEWLDDPKGLPAMTERRSSDDARKGSTASIRQDALTGWVVFRPKPWHFVGVFGSREEAELERERAGVDYQAAFGTADGASGRFEVPGSK